MKQYAQYLEANQQREGLRTFMAISRAGNLYLQDTKPWELVKTDKTRYAINILTSPVNLSNAHDISMNRCGTVIATALALVRLLAVLSWPYMPGVAEHILRDQLNLPARPTWINEFSLDLVTPGHALGSTGDILFKKIDTNIINELRRRFRGNQVEGTFVKLFNSFRGTCL